MEVYTTVAVSNVEEVRAMEVDTTIPRTFETADNNENYVLVCRLSCEYFESVESIANLEQITKVRYPLQEVMEERKIKLRKSIKQNGFKSIRGGFTVILPSTPKRENHLMRYSLRMTEVLNT